MEFIKAAAAVIFLSISVHASPTFLMKKSSQSFKFYTRADWDAQPATDNHPLRKPVPYVVIHHTYIPAACYTMEDCARKMRSMQNYHNGLDWGDIGYNFCVGSEGGAYEGRGWDIKGIHAGPANNHSIGICLIGDWRVQLPPQGQLETTKALITEGVKLGKVSADYKLVGHIQVMSTECPGGALFAEIATWDHFVSGKPDLTMLSTKVSPISEKSDNHQ